MSTNAGANPTMSNASGSSAAAANGISDVNSNNPLSDSGNTAATSNSASTSGSAIQSSTTTSAYTLYLEHLGGFLPILKGKRVSKIRPEFIIYDPQLPGTLRI